MLVYMADKQVQNLICTNDSLDDPMHCYSIMFDSDDIYVSDNLYYLLYVFKVKHELDTC